MALRAIAPVLCFATLAGKVNGLSLAPSRDAKSAALRLSSSSPCAPDASQVLSLVASGEQARDKEVLLKFYMYDTGAFNITDIMDCFFTQVNGTLGIDEMDVHVPPQTAQHMTDYWLLEQMAKHPSRTDDPAKADFFVIGAPLMSSWFASKLQGRCQHLRHHFQRVEAVRQELLASKYWAKNGGRDHFFINTSPWGHLELSTHGDLYKMLFNEGQVIYATADRKYRGLDLYKRAIVVPYKAHYLLDQPGQSREEQTREVPVTFHGDMGRGIGWRSRIPKLAAGIPGASIHDLRVTHGYIPMEELRVSITDTAQTYLNSSFCLVPSGDTPTSRRLFDALAAGCVPVVFPTFADLADSLPFKNTIDWSEIAIFAGEVNCVAQDMDSMSKWMEDLMKSRDGRDVREMRELGTKAFRYLSYHSPDMVDALLREVQPHLA